MSATRRKVFPAPPINVVSTNLLNVELKLVDLNSRQIGIAANTAFPVVTRNGLSEVEMPVISWMMSFYFLLILCSHHHANDFVETRRRRVFWAAYTPGRIVTSVVKCYYLWDLFLWPSDDSFDSNQLLSTKVFDNAVLMKVYGGRHL